MSSAPVEVVIHKPIALSQISEHPLIQIAGSFDSLNGVEYPGKTSIYKLPIVVLRNDVVAVTIEMLLLLMAVEEKTVDI